MSETALDTTATTAVDHARAILLDARTLVAPLGSVWDDNPDGNALARRQAGWALLWSPAATIPLENPQIGPDVHVIRLTERDGGLEDAQLERRPDLTGRRALRLPTQWRRSVPEMLTGQLLLARLHGSHVVALTGLQLGEALDVLLAPQASKQHLGPDFSGHRIALRVWAPTARHITLLLWDADSGAAPAIDQAERRTMLRDADGVWTTRIPHESVGARYLFEVTVYSSVTGHLETNVVTDPYSTGLTVDSQRSVVVNLDDPDLEPDDWALSHGPRLAQLVDAAVYELHVRDFSMSDDLVPEALRGTYLAFTVDGHGARHLHQLAVAGLNTVHLLPCFDITSIPEADPSPGPDPAVLAALPPDSHEQQRLVAETADRDGYNWGYDPWHWGVPEGSYASSAEAANDGTRTHEFRRMVHALHGLGLRVVMDQVFTHTGAAGLDPHSVFGRIVPGYYHRLDDLGIPQDSTCMNNVATERIMVEKVMIDMVIRWAVDYHVDGFRFDLMGHSTAGNMANLRAALDELTMETHGIDGTDVYLYGEGWNFGEVANNALFRQATQGQLSDTRIGTFNDRLRDAVRGGRPFDQDPHRQGLGSGLADDPNGHWCTRGNRSSLGPLTDLAMLSLAGNLRDHRLVCSDGVERRGDSVDYDGSPAGYADEPCDVINYVDAHDNETLWDALTTKLPRQMPMADRVRMNTVSLAFATLGQGPFLWHAGADLLRSKSLDRNSFDSGDWFNRLDWTGADNGFGRGLPPAADNMTRWPWLKPLLADPTLKPTAEDVAVATAAAQDLLRIRRWSRLFRLGSASLIHQKLSFPLSGGPGAVEGVITMHVDDRIGLDIDPELDGLVVVFNTTGGAVRQSIESLAGEHVVLCPVQADGSDPVVRKAFFDGASFEVPARTVAVFAHLH